MNQSMVRIGFVARRIFDLASIDAPVGAISRIMALRDQPQPGHPLPAPTKQTFND
jgi:hypothetical protein